MIPYRTFPEIDLGPFLIKTFGLFVGVGIAVGVWVFLRFARRKGLDTEALTSLAWRVVVFALIGSRLLFVLTHLDQFTDDPLSVFAVWEGGLQFSGGFLAALVVIWLWLRKHPEVQALVLTDGMVLGLVPGLMLGRCGCYAVGEHFGGETSFFLGTEYRGGETREGPIVPGTTIHNTALYEILLLIPLLILLWQMNKRGVKEGWITATFLVWYGTQRFLTDFLRAYDKTVLGLTGAQYMCVGLVAVGVGLMVNLRRKGRDESVTPDPVDPSAATV
ncbi:MAG: prolipoprotein diacylglyceryl transferase family protein [Actinomycetota bacterium]